MKKIISCLLGGLVSVSIVLPFNIINIFAYGTNWESSGQYRSFGSLEGRYYNSSQSRTNFTLWTLSSTTDNSGAVNDGGILFYKGRDNTAYSMLVYAPVNTYYLVKGWSSNGINYSFSNTKVTGSKVTTDNQNIQHTIYFSTTTAYYSPGGSNTFTNTGDIITLRAIFGNVPIINSSSYTGDELRGAILDVINTDSTYYPWAFSDSSGGYHWDDGVTIDNDNRTLYNNVYTIMDVDNDNSVTQEEVNYYNYTNNTNYDFQAINNDNDFNNMEFLYYVAVKLMANENPGGDGGGSSGGDPGDFGGITVTDSFTQSQTQSIAENAVNVTINNDGSINNDNSQFINSVINNNLAGEGAANAFETALGTVSSFVNVGQSFASLASAVLGFLPAWVTTLLSLMFTLLFVMVVFRLIHLFI